MGGNPKDSGRTVAPSSRGLIGYAQARVMSTGNTQQPRTTTWQANGMIQPAIMSPMIQQPMLTPMMIQAQPQQQQQMMRHPTHPMMQHQPQQLWAMNASGNMVPYQNNNGNINGNGMSMGGNNGGAFF